MIGKILFYVLSIALFAIMFIKLMRKIDNLYLSSIILQSIGIAINFIALVFGFELNAFFTILTCLFSVIIPIFILVCEYYEIDITEKIYVMIAKAYLFSKDTKGAKKILLALIDKNDNCKEAHKMLAEIYEKEGGLRRAIDEYIKVVDLDSKAYDSYFKIAVLLKELGNNRVHATIGSALDLFGGYLHFDEIVQICKT